MSKISRSPAKTELAVVPAARWAAYATAGAATAIACTPNASAEIHYVSVNIPVDAGAPSSGILKQLPLLPGAYLTFIHATGPNGGGAAGFYFGTNGAVSAKFIGVAGTYGGLPFHYVGRLNLGDNIAGGNFLGNVGRNNGFISNPLASGAGYPNSQWAAVVKGFMGLRFDVGSGQQYGWVQLSMNGPNRNSFTIVDYAFADPGQTLVAGQVPEPGSLALLAFGAVGLLLWRQKRAAAAN